MTLPNYVYQKGDILVAPGGGGALTPLPPGADGQVLGASKSSPLGVAWGVGSSSGNVVGPDSSVTGNLPSFADTSGALLQDSGIASATVAKGPGTSTANHIAAFDDTDGVTLIDSGVLYTSVVLGPSSAVGNNFAGFNSTTGKLILDSGYNAGSFRPSAVTGGGAATKGTFTLTAGSSGNIATTAVLTASSVLVTVTSLGTVSVASSFLVTITNGSHFVLTASAGTDTSSGTWQVFN
jgi:hypothetical protein